jgi:hypothetical protein
MKTCILGLCILGFTSLFQAQNDLAMVTPNVNEVTNYKTTSKNAKYLEHMSVKPIAIRIQKLQNLAANYDIKTQPVYSNNKFVTYTVIFKENENYINAIYDHDGTIIQCEEYYTNIRMPYSISGQLAKDYPGWEFRNITCAIDYSQDKTTNLAYQVELQKNKKFKTVTITQ